MRAKWIFALLVLWVLLVTVPVISVPKFIARFDTMQLRIIGAIAAIVPLVLLWLLYVNLLHPISAINNGMFLVRAQDFASRLVKVGQKDADDLVGMFNKMIDRLKEERLRNIEQNHFLQLLIQASPMGIIIFDYDGKITMANPTMLSMLEQSAGEIEGHAISDFKGEVATAIAETKQGETRTVRFSDTKIVRISRLNFLELGFARPYVMVEVLTNEVIKAEKDAYGKVIRLIAHEVNNTMAGVNSMLETLSLIMEQEADIAEAIESCRERCASMSEFITSYADVVRIPEAKLDRLELNGRIARMMPFLEGLAGETIHIQFTPADDEVFVKADTVLLEQVMVNIIKNSKESILSASGVGEIKISVKARPARIEITDNGAGISGEAAHRLFSPFFSTKRGGQGIGLMMVGDILRQHNCRFSLRTDSTGVDSSTAKPLTRFNIQFP